MNKQKQILSLLVTVVLILTFCFPAFAADITDTGATTVAHTVAATWMATIPAYVEPAEQGRQTAEYAVTLEQAVIPDGKQLTASVAYSGAMTEQNGVELPYKLYDDSGNEIQSGAQILTETAGAPDESVSVSFGAALTAKAKYAGVYTDTATFTFDVTEKTYTAEEIDANPLLYGIGKTKPEYVVAQFNENYTEVTIFKNGDDSDGVMKDWNDVINEYSPFYDYATILKRAIILNEVTSMGSIAFKNCKSLSSVVIPDSVTEIGTRAFYGCQSLKYITLPDNVTNIETQAFGRCTALTAVTLPSRTTSIARSVFQDCTSLKAVTIPEGVTKIDSYAFDGCSALDSITIPNSVTSIAGYAFQDCTSLKAIIIPAGITDIEINTFFGCTSLESVMIPESVTRIGNYAFSGCSALKSIVIPDRVTNIGTGAFSSCSSLTNIAIPDSVTSIGDSAFRYCDKLINITVGISNPNYSDIDGVLFNKNKTDLIQYPSGKVYDSYFIPDGVKSIKDFAFNRCSALISIDIPNGVNSIGKSAFYGCQSLQSIAIPDSVTSIGSSSFGYCTSLESMVIPNRVTSIEGSTFFYCIKLTSVTIPENVNSISSSAFSKCSSLATICGTPSSYAESWATENGYTFVAQ